jgi:putative transposase
MKKCTTFQSILKPLTKNLITEGIKRFNADYDCRTLKAWDHLLTMIYAQIHELKSLRTLEIAFNSQTNLLNLTGANKIRRSTLSDANHRRPSEFFFWILEKLMSLLPRKIHKEIKKVVRLLDSSPFQLKGRGYDEWAKANRTLRCQGLKLHVEYDLECQSPTRVKTSAANYNDSTMGQSWSIERDTIYVFDKGYYDFNWWWSLHQKQAYFVTRLKKNVAIIKKIKREVTGEIILEDSTFIFKNKSPRGGKKNLYTENLRLIVVKREGKDPLILVTNLQDVSAETIAELYKARWDIELFFKWIKQNLRIKKFLGRSANAVKIQLATALIAYLLIQLFKMNAKKEFTLQQTLIWVRHNFYRKESHFNINDPPLYCFTRQSLVNREGVHL